MGRCSYRHNMWCNCKKPISKLKSYEEIMELGWARQKVEELNKYPQEYFNKFNSEWHMVSRDNVYYLQWASDVVFPDENNLWFTTR